MSSTSQSKVCINVTVRVLYLLNQGDPVCKLLFQYGFLSYHIRIIVIVDYGQGIGNCLDTLVDIGILEYITLEFIVRLSVELLNRVYKVRLSAGRLLDLIDRLVQRVHSVYFLFRIPEVICQLYIFKCNRAVRLRCNLRFIYRNFRNCIKCFITGCYRTFYFKGLSNLIFSV